jgi:ribosomal protein S18 acetylase RimI-like enzyme
VNNINIKQIDAPSAELVIGLFDQYRVFYKQPSDLALAKKYIDARLQHKESIIFVALDENQVPVGFTQLFPKYSSVRAVKNWILNDLYVDANFRRKGIGQKLVETATAFAAADEAKFVQLETAIDNYTAQSLYEALGFKKQEPETGFLLYKIGINS